MRALAILLLCVTASAASAAPTEQQCSAAANLSVSALQWRRNGINEDAAMEFLRSRKIYSGLPVWAIKQAYDAPPDVPAWILRGSIFNACLERKE